MHLKLTVFLLMAVLLSGCVYKQDIRQGNQFDKDDIAQLKPGETTRAQVRFLLGTPIVADPFHPDRWDYVFYYKNGKTNRVTQRRLVVYFDGEVIDRVVENDS